MAEDQMESFLLTKKGLGRLTSLKMPEHISDTPDNVAQAIMKHLLPKERRYLKKHHKQKAS